MKIGLFGGSFDPVHRAHFHLAQQSLKQFALDRVIWIPASVSPYKKSSDLLASPEQRLAMVQLVCNQEPKFETSDYEIKKGGISYSIETLRHFQQVFKAAQFFWILGADALEGILNWKESETLIQELTFIAAGRQKEINHLPVNIKIKPLQFNFDPASATAIRKGLAEGKCWEQLDSRVAAYIRAQHLYGVSA